MKLTLPKVFAAATLAGLAVITTANAEGPADKLKGQTVHLVVGYGPGGGFDTYARMIAPYLGKELGATVIVDNRPGGGGNTATNQIFRAEPDGLTQYLINGVPATLGEIVHKPGVSYKLEKMTWLARVNADAWGIMVNKDTPYKNVQDFIDAKKPITFAALARADGPSDGAATLCASLKIKCHIVLGFQGTSEASLAVIRGEADAIVMTDTSVYDNTHDGQARAVGVLGTQRSNLFPDLKTVAEQVDLDKDGKFWNDYRASIADVGRSIVAPPGMDPALRDYLASAWEKVLHNPELLAKGKKIGRDFNYSSAEESQKRMDDIFSGDASSRADQIQDVLLKRFF